MAVSSDWQSDGTLVECLKHLLKESVSADVTFLLGQDQDVVKAHKAILISRSPVFFAMLEGPLAEKAEIAIPDISKRTFSKLLEYIYTDEVALNVKTVTPLLYAARKYMVNQLVKECLCFLDKRISIQNVGALLEEAYTYSEDELQQKCLRVIQNNPDAFLKAKGFSKLCKSCLMAVVDMNDLVVEEETVYKAVLRWSKAQCKRQNLEITDKNQRQVLGDVMFGIRFPLMDETFFAREVCCRDILTAEEVVDVIRSRHRKESIAEGRFKTESRCDPHLLKTANTTDSYREIEDTTVIQEDYIIQHAMSVCYDAERKYDAQDIISIVIEDSIDSSLSIDTAPDFADKMAKPKYSIHKKKKRKLKKSEEKTSRRTRYNPEEECNTSHDRIYVD